MKVFRWLGNPMFLIVMYLLLVIEGDEFGGFFLLYLLLALPHLMLYSVFASIGIVAIVVGYNIDKKELDMVKKIFYVVGLALMLIALVIFFSKGNKDLTFSLFVPLTTVIIFSLSSIFFLINNVFAAS